jgi:hypothetical protein
VSAAAIRTPSPAGASTTQLARRHETTRHARTAGCRPTTRPLASTNTTSIGKRMPNVCTERQRTMASATPAGGSRSSASPSSRARSERA